MALFTHQKAGMRSASAIFKTKYRLYAFSCLGEIAKRKKEKADNSIHTGCDGRNLKTITALALSFVKGTAKCIPLRKGDFH